MTKKVFLTMLSFSIMVGSAQASKLVVMGVNLNGDAPAGQKTYTIGMDTEGAAGFLAVGQLIFTGTGAGGNPKQGNSDTGLVFTGNRQDRQSLEVGPNANLMRYDSWWFVAGNGLLQDLDGNTVTTDPVVGTNGFLWTPQATGITGGTSTGADIGLTATYGPFPTQLPVGVYPLLQVRTSGDLSVAFGPGAKLSVQTPTGEVPTNWLGGDQAIDSQAVLCFAQDAVVTASQCIVPEPSSLVLAGLGLVALVGLARRRRK